MKITDVEAIVLRQPAVDESIADGIQDDLVVRVHTDAGRVGAAEIDSAPEVGYVDVPTAPGLGIDLDPEVLDRLAVGLRPLPIGA